MGASRSEPPSPACGTSVSVMEGAPPVDTLVHAREQAQAITTATVRARRIVGGILRLITRRDGHCTSSRGPPHTTPVFVTAAVPDGAVTRIRRSRLASPECKGERLHAGIEELDLELPVGDWRGLADQLVQTRLDHRTVAAFVGIDAAGSPGRLPVDRHAETDRGSLPR